MAGVFSFLALNFQTLLVLLLAFLTAAFLFYGRGRRQNLPPGPPGLPLVGNLFSMRPSKLLSNMAAWRQQYGDVYCVRVVNRVIVVICGHYAIHDALLKQPDIFSDRPTAMRSIGKRDPGLVVAPYGDAWQKRRRFALTALRQFGMGKRSIEGRIKEETEALCTAMRFQDGAPTDIAHLLSNAVSNIICSMSFGNRFEYDDEEFKRLSDAITFLVGGTNRSIGGMVRNAVMPYIRKLPLLKNLPSQGLKMNDYIINFIKRSADDHKTTFDKSDIRDIIDVFLNEESSSDDGQESLVSGEALGTIIRDLFIAGTETTATTLKWGLLYTALHPDVQATVQEEIDRLFGSEVPPWSSREKLPYTEATLMEIQRIRSIVPLNVPHGTTSATTFYGYDIPAGTYVIPSLWSAMMDPNVTSEPDEFRPERFLDEEGKVSRPEWFLPFSTGRRRCLGEQLAKMELFLFYTSLLQHFTFKLPDGAPAPPMDGRLGFVLSPPQYDICAVPRHAS